MSVMFGRYHPITIVRNRGSESEHCFEARVGGTLDDNILYTPDVTIQRGDEIDADVLDETRVVTDIHP